MFKIGDREFPTINAKFVETHPISLMDAIYIQRGHKIKTKLFQKMEASDDPNELKMWDQQVTKNEFDLQKFWGFPQNESMHKFWLVPKCTCPKMDNEERYGQEHGFIINNDCKVHGNLMQDPVVVDRDL